MTRPTKPPPIRPRANTVSLATLLDELAATIPAPDVGTVTCRVAEVLGDHHPDRVGRVQVHWQTPQGPVSRWVPTLWGLPIRCGDRVLLQQPGNWPEPVVVGVVDGFTARPPRTSQAAATLDIRTDQHVEIVGSRGRPLLAVHEGPSGPVVRLLSEDLDLEVPGRFRVRARSLQLQSEQGAEIDAQGDVVVRGETIHLN
jgi:hypothetical protein